MEFGFNTVHGLCVVSVHGLCTVRAWSVYGLCTVSVHGLCMVCAWSVHSPCMICAQSVHSLGMFRAWSGHGRACVPIELETSTTMSEHTSSCNLHTMEAGIGAGLRGLYCNLYMG